MAPSQLVARGGALFRVFRPSAICIFLIPIGLRTSSPSIRLGEPNRGLASSVWKLVARSWSSIWRTATTSGATLSSVFTMPGRLANRGTMDPSRPHGAKGHLCTERPRWQQWSRNRYGNCSKSSSTSPIGAGLNPNRLVSPDVTVANGDAGSASEVKMTMRLLRWALLCPRGKVLQDEDPNLSLRRSRSGR